MTKVIITEKLHDETVDLFRTLPEFEYTFCSSIKDVTDEMLADAEVIIGNVTPEMTAKAPELRWVQLFSAGANNYGWLPEHITLSNAFGGYGAGMSEHMLAAVLMIMKLFPAYIEQQKEHQWKRIDGITQMKDAKVLSVGMGGIGTAFLEHCFNMGAHCYGVRRTVHDKPDFVEALYTMDTMTEILPECDVVALSMPETPETAGMFNEALMRKMKKGAILINVGRGSAIVQEDLIRLAKEGWFKGVSLDVTVPEPLPQNNELWTTPNIFITPHVSGGWTSPVNYQNVIGVVFENLKRDAAGEAPVHVVDRSIGY